jgi:DUF4097 and DUF4098 domain-containing protein YvlB
MTDTSTRSPRRSGAQRVLLAVGGVVALALIAWGVLQLVSVLGRTTTQRELTLTPTGGRLKVDMNGGIRIETGSGPEVRVVERLHYGLRKPRVTETVTADGLEVKAGCAWFNPNCSVDAVLTVPADLAVDAHSSGGDITVSGLTGTVQLDSSGGGITASGLTGSVVLESSGGDITASGLTGAVRMDSSGGGVRASGLRSGQVDAHSSGGDVVLAFDAPPDRVRADSSGGGVRIELPRVDSGYHVNADSSGGDTHTEVPTDPQSPRLIEAHSSGGDVRILTRQAA